MTLQSATLSERGRGCGTRSKEYSGLLEGRKQMPRFRLHHALLANVAFAAAAVAAPAQAAIACADLVNLKIAARDIGLPSGGATIVSAALAAVPADPATPDVKREYCTVPGAVQPVDPNAPPVNFQVNLPVQCAGFMGRHGKGAGATAPGHAGKTAAVQSQRIAPHVPLSPDAAL